MKISKPTVRDPATLGRRERRILDLLHKGGAQTVSQILDSVPNPPSYSGVRALLRILERKGHVAHDAVRNRYVYRPIEGRYQAGKSMLAHIMKTYCQGSPIELAAMLLRTPNDLKGDEWLLEVRQLVEARIAEMASEERQG